MIQRENRPEFINAICNSDGVRPWIDYRGVPEPMDFTPACDRVGLTGILFLSNGEDAIGCFGMTGEREWQVHTFFGDTCRGRKAIDTARAMVDYMLPRYAKRLWGATPMNNRKARWFNRQCGFRVVGNDVYDAEGPVEIVERL